MKLENIDKSIQKQDILQGISLEVSPQKLTAFIGPNGAGKSTLLSIMSRLTKKDRGVLSIKGREIESWNSQELAQELTIIKQKINYKE
ncbi:ATP-binding cassette domain-containing protein, partial [Staphylococcus aureus]|nr:ATP-binding cassette domain-containing protein [Staphylococcus aureus]